MDSTGLWTVSIGLSANVTAILGFTGSANLVFDDNGNIAIQGSYGGIPTETPYVGILDAGVGVTFSVMWNADTIYDLEGTTVAGGLSGGPVWYVGGDVLWRDEGNHDRGVDGVQLTGSVGIGVDMHVSTTTTETLWVIHKGKEKKSTSTPSIQRPVNQYRKPSAMTPISPPISHETAREYSNFEIRCWYISQAQTR